MSYGVALRNGIPFTLGTIAALCVNATGQAWSPRALWPTGTEPGMWIDPSNLTSQWQDSTGTTPVATPGSVADSSNPVGLALDLRLGAPTTLGPELVVNGDFSTGISDWDAGYSTPTLTWNSSEHRIVLTGPTYATAGQAFSVVAGKTYRVSVNTYGSGAYFWAGLGLSGPELSGLYQNGSLMFTADATGSVYVVLQNRGVDNVPVEFDNISAREVPGNHLLQATSTARPLVSARVNLLTYTEDFSSGWLKNTCTTPAQTPPPGYSSAVKYIKDSGAGFASVYRYYNTTGQFVFSAIAKRAECQYLCLYLQNPDRFGYFDLLNGVVGTVPAGLTATIEDLGDGWYRCAVAHTANGTNAPSIFATSTDNVYAPIGDGVSGIYVTAAQYNNGGVSAPYQPILTDGSTYPSTGFPIYQKYDGTDDGMATATFAAGTLSNAMDCMIAVRRDSTVLPSICGLYQVDQTRYFGVVGEEPSSGASTFGSCGSPTLFVDGVSVANTRGALHSAIGVGDWHILEYRNLDLSAWVNAGFGSYGFPYMLNGAQGGILLFPSSTSTADRDAARTWLGAKVGLTL